MRIQPNWSPASHQAKPKTLESDQGTATLNYLPIRRDGHRLQPLRMPSCMSSSDFLFP